MGSLQLYMNKIDSTFTCCRTWVFPKKIIQGFPFVCHFTLASALFCGSKKKKMFFHYCLITLLNLGLLDIYSFCLECRTMADNQLPKANYEHRFITRDGNNLGRKVASMLLTMPCQFRLLFVMVGSFPLLITIHVSAIDHSVIN